MKAYRGFHQKFFAIAAVCLLAGAATPSRAGVIISPVSAVINSGGPGFGSIDDTFNHNGLLSGFTSGVTNFGAYLATNPLHSYIFAGNEWFSNSGTTSASVTYNLGSVTSISSLALWNEESSGIGSLDLFRSTDGISFSSLASGLKPTDNPLADYGADVFNFATVAAQYVRFDMSGCPQANPGSFPACAIGEVAFQTSAVSAVPEPSTWAMMILGFVGIGFMTYRRRKSPLALVAA